MNQRSKILLSIVLGLLLLVIWLYIIDVEEMFNIFKNVKILFIFPLGLFFILIYFLRSLRWKIILSPVEKITMIESFNLCMTNYFINFLIPVHAGEVAKSFLLKKMKGTPISKSLLTIYVDKITDLLPIFLLLLAAPFQKKQLSYLIYLTSGILLLALLLFILLLTVVLYKKNVALKSMEKIFFFLPTEYIMKLKYFLNLFVEGIFSITRLSNRLLEILGLTMLALVLHCAFMWLFFYSFGIELPILTVIVAYLLLNASFILPAPPGFAGTLELSFVFIFTYIYGYEKNLVSAVAASSHIFIAALFGLFGLSSMALIGTKLSTILKIESQSKVDLEKLQVNN